MIWKNNYMIDTCMWNNCKRKQGKFQKVELLNTDFLGTQFHVLLPVTILRELHSGTAQHMYWSLRFRIYITEWEPM